MLRFLFPRKLTDKTRNIVILCLLFVGLYYWSGEEARYIRNQRNLLFDLPRDQLPDDGINRQMRVWDRCAVMGQHGGFQSPRIKEFFFPPTTIIAPNAFYCPVGGAASTFLTRYILAIDQLDKKSPFDIPIEMAEKEKMGQLHSLGTDPRQEQFLSQVVKFVFVRNPFSRIFSTYIEKLFSPNPVYWKKWGRNAISKSDFDSKFYGCGSFMSFRHFVKLVVEELWKTDDNLMPISTLCQLCKIPYDVIGKLEFAMRDIRFLSEKLNVSTHFMDQPKYLNDATNDHVKDVTRNAFGKWNKDIKKCFDSFEVGRIIWRRLQITGVIDARFSFPLSREEMEMVSRKKFQDLCMAAAKNSQDKTRLRSQRYEALVEAYQTVDHTDLEALQGIYAQDFYLLGYDFNSSSVFTRKKVEGERLIYSKILDWRALWDRNVDGLREKEVEYPI